MVAMLLAADADSDGTLGCALSCLPLRFLGTSFCLQFAKVGKNFSVLPGPIQKARCSRVLAKFHPVGILFGKDVASRMPRHAMSYVTPSFRLVGPVAHSRQHGRFWMGALS